MIEQKELKIEWSSDPGFSKKQILIDGEKIGMVQKIIVDLDGAKIFFPDYDAEGLTITHHDTWKSIKEAALKVNQCLNCQPYLVDFRGIERPFPTFFEEKI